MDRVVCFGIVGTVCFLLPLSAPDAAELPVPAGKPAIVPYDGLQAGADAQRYHETLRQRATDRQLGLIGDMQWYSGLPTWYGGNTYVYRPFSLDHLYAYGPGRSRAGPWRDGYVFAPWPYVPGDIWGYQHEQPVRQSLGQRQVQIGPNRWESHPVYADTDSPDNPVAAPETIPAPKLPRRGPREF
jgi:hypothetical protein